MKLAVANRTVRRVEQQGLVSAAERMRTGANETVRIRDYAG